MEFRRVGRNLESWLYPLHLEGTQWLPYYHFYDSLCIFSNSKVSKFHVTFYQCHIDIKAHICSVNIGYSSSELNQRALMVLQNRLMIFYVVF